MESGSISHLLYADDTVVFCGTEGSQLRYLRCVLLCFEAISGLKINLGKSKLIGIKEGVKTNDLATNLGYGVGTLPNTYLGLPLGPSYKAKSVWDPVMERFEKRLSGWKKGGKLTLIRSTLASLPTYYMSLFRIPTSVVNKLEKLRRDFLWEGMEGEKKLHLVNWKTICMTKEEGGLGIKDLVQVNRTLLGKWL